MCATALEQCFPGYGPRYVADHPVLMYYRCL